jgi:hypothetical protein
MSAWFERGIGRSCRSHRMQTDSDGLSADAGRLCIFHDDVAVDGPRIEVLIERASPVVHDRPEEGRVQAFMAHHTECLSE